MKKKKLKIKKMTLSSVVNLNDVVGGAGDKPPYRQSDYCLTTNCVTDFNTGCDFQTHGCCDGV